MTAYLHRLRGVTAVALLGCLLGFAGTAMAQEIHLRNVPLDEARSGPAPRPAEPAETRSPESVRRVLRSIHGFTRAALDAASTDVPDILMAIADDPDEAMALRRQAVKALGLYPDEAVLAFIEAEFADAPDSLQRIYLTTLRAFADTAPERATHIAAERLSHQDALMRNAALELAKRLPSSDRLVTALSTQLQQETDPNLRRELEETLQAKR